MTINELEYNMVNIYNEYQIQDDILEKLSGSPDYGLTQNMEKRGRNMGWRVIPTPTLNDVHTWLINLENIRAILLLRVL